MQYKFSLKGGSLSSTDVVIENNVCLVRKSISATSEREFGFTRWYGQYKKMQRLSDKFPDLVPSPHNFDVKKGYLFIHCPILPKSYKRF